MQQNKNEEIAKLGEKRAKAKEMVQMADEIKSKRDKLRATEAEQLRLEDEAIKQW